MPVENDLVVESVLDDVWDVLLKQFEDTNYRQLAAYSTAVAARVGARSENVAIRHGSNLLGLCNVRTRKLPLLPFGISYVNGAPLIQQSGSAVDDYATLLSCLRALRNEYVMKRGLMLRIVGVARSEFQPDEASRIFQDAGFVPTDAKGRYRTIVVDVKRTLTDIRAALDRKWRGHLNKAERQGLEIVRGTEARFIQEYIELHRGLVARKDLKIDLGPDFFLNIQDKLPVSDRFVVHLAMHAGEVVAGHIGAYQGDTAVYLLGASNEAGLKSNASYLLQWRVIEYAKERGCLWYDLGGIDPEGNPNVYEFKARMGGSDICAPGPYEAGSPLTRVSLKYLESLYRMLHK